MDYYLHFHLYDTWMTWIHDVIRISLQSNIISLLIDGVFCCKYLEKSFGDWVYFIWTHAIPCLDICCAYQLIENFFHLSMLQIKMLEYRENRLQMEPLKFSSAYSSDEELDSLEFRKVVCKGYFDDKKSIYVGPRSRSISGITENGYYIITPLMPVPNCPDR